CREAHAGSRQRIEVGARRVRSAPGAETVGPSRVEQQEDDGWRGGGRRTDQQGPAAEPQNPRRFQAGAPPGTKVNITDLIRRWFQARPKPDTGPPAGRRPP